MANYTERAKILDSLDNYGTMNGELWSDSAPCCYFPRRYVVVALCFVCLLIIYLYRVILSVAILPIAEEYEWDDPTRGLVLSSFFWGYIFTQIPGGYLAQKYGGKVVLGTGVMFASLFTIVTPFFASQLPIFIVARFLTGFAEGVSYPTVHHLMARWLPKTERGAITFAWSGAHVGTVLSYLISPYIINEFHWPSLFFITGGMGLMWCCAWLVFVEATPDILYMRRKNHCLPMAESEYQYIKFGVPPALDEDQHIPWCRLLSSSAVWAIIITHFAANWGFYVLLTWLPTYFDKELGFDLENAGFFSVLPFLLTAVIAMITGRLSDCLINKRIMSLLTARKFFQSLGALSAALFLTLLAVTKPSVPLAITFMISV
jgi:ACS family sodium-dependent inorganic phosphate cotransporter